MTEKTLKGFSIHRLFDLLVQATKELTLANKEDMSIINIIEGNMLLLRRVMIAKRAKNLAG